MKITIKQAAEVFGYTVDALYKQRERGGPLGSLFAADKNGLLLAELEALEDANERMKPRTQGERLNKLGIRLNDEELESLKLKAGDEPLASWARKCLLT